MKELRQSKVRTKKPKGCRVSSCVAVCFLLLFPIASWSQEPITLEQAVQIATQKNPALQTAEEDARAAHARVGQIRANWYPRLDFAQGFSRGNNPVYVFGTLLTQRRFTAANFALSSLNAPRPLDNFQTRFDGTMLLFDAGRTHLHVRGARGLATAADCQTEQARQDLLLRVLRAYYGVIVARENLAATREALRAAESNEERVRTLEKAGLVVTSDRLSAQVFRAQVKDHAIRAESALELARAVFVRELGLDLEARREPAGTLAEPAAPPTTLAQWEQIALAERPALRAAVLEHDAATAQRQSARAEFGPKLGLYANFERDALALGGPSGTNWTAGARLEWNLFAGGADRYRLLEAQARERQADHQLDWLRSGVRLEVRESYFNAVAAAERAATARDAVEQAQESVRIVQNRYAAGLSTITELLRVQTSQLEARIAYLAALHDWQVARAQIERAAGVLTPDSKLIRQPAPDEAKGAETP